MYTAHVLSSYFRVFVISHIRLGIHFCCLHSFVICFGLDIVCALRKCNANNEDYCPELYIYICGWHLVFIEYYYAHDEPTGAGQGTNKTQFATTT